MFGSDIYFARFSYILLLVINLSDEIGFHAYYLTKFRTLWGSLDTKIEYLSSNTSKL